MAQIARGYQIYNDKGTCFACHGFEGDIEKISATAKEKWDLLNPKPSDFMKANTLKLKSNEERFKAIKYGIRGTAMVNVGQVANLTDDEIWDVIAYLDELQARLQSITVRPPRRAGAGAIKLRSGRAL